MNRTLFVCLAAMLARTAPVMAADRLLPEPGPAVVSPGPSGDAGDRPGKAILALYGVAVALQSYDGYATIVGATSNRVETAARTITLNGVAAAATIAAADRLWRTHHRKQAIVLLVVSNGLIAAMTARRASAGRVAQ